ncbi:hypothetical protein GA0115255_104983 [Streptomyces sp. Ncost-T6T-2b]|nr:hypothetical protein GA0115255_104983 [Streptomyces sp. Ncost-T6T-2b]
MSSSIGRASQPSSTRSRIGEKVANPTDSRMAPYAGAAISVGSVLSIVKVTLTPPSPATNASAPPRLRSRWRGSRPPAAAVIARRTARNAAPTEASRVMLMPAEIAMGPNA